MSEINLGRVQGGGFFGSTGTSETVIGKLMVITNGVTPLIGDTIINANGALCRIVSEHSSSSGGYYSVQKYSSIKGDKGDKGDKGEKGLGFSYYVKSSSDNPDNIMSVVTLKKQNVNVVATINDTTILEALRTNLYSVGMVFVLQGHISTSTRDFMISESSNKTFGGLFLASDVIFPVYNMNYPLVAQDANGNDVNSFFVISLEMPSTETNTVNVRFSASFVSNKISLVLTPVYAYVL